MTQTQFTNTGGASSQCETILAELQANAGEWVPMPHLALSARCFSVRSRISDLRDRGHTIENDSKRDKETRQVHSYYRLVPNNHPIGFGAAEAQLQGHDRDLAIRQLSAHRGPAFLQ